ncbi:hypothetical protein [Salinisphaera sp. G21_0]|uniref:hypothetical protein n=1 Tax=Salinisphaera sp. G21_0 TaxID=2821094 RepID=UPI001ADAF8E8|nr:hypothetical protein [Salinisphaera sp. G21_0]MBO9484373.1 hypothetical protein [Salinisphaera sp. G21_0]
MARIRIGNEQGYLPNCNYIQEANFDAGNHSPIVNFTGKYNGNGKSISNLKNCLIQNLQGDGAVRNLVVKDSNIKSEVKLTEGSGKTVRKADALAFIACSMEQQSNLENNTVQHSSIEFKRETDDANPLQYSQVGMLAGEIKNSASLKGNRIEQKSTIDIRGVGINAGMVTGQALDTSVIDSNDIDQCKLSISGGLGTGYKGTFIEGPHLIIREWGVNINAGLVVGKISGDAEGKVTVRDSILTENELVTSDKIAAANVGGVAARADHAVINNTQAHNNTIKLNFRQKGHIAVVVADASHCEIRGTIASDNDVQVKSMERYNYFKYNPSLLGVVTAGCYNSKIENTRDINSKLVNGGAKNYFPLPELAGHAAVAAAFSHGCTIRNTTATGTRIETNGQRGSVAIAAVFNYGRTKVHQTTAIDCQLSAIGPDRDGLKTEGSGAVAVAVGSGRGVFGVISDTTACNSNIKGFHTGIAAGYPDREFPGTVACSTNLTSWANGNSMLDNSGCVEEKCPKESTDAPPTRLTTTTTTTTAGTGGDHATTDALSSTLGTPGDSTVTPATTDNPDYPSYSPSAKTVTASPSQPLPSATVSSSLVNGTDNQTFSPLNADEVDAGIPLPTLAAGVAAGVLTGGIVLYASYQWYQGYQQGLRGTALALRPITRIRDAICCHAPAIMENKRDSMELVSLRPTFESEA